MKKLLLVLTVIFSFAFISKNEKITVIIDAGHGGTDLGATINGISEKEIVASIAHKIQLLNTDKNIDIILTRNDNQDLSLQERVAFINKMKPDLVISLHANASKNIEANGLEVYVSDKSSEYGTSNLLAVKYINSFSNKLPLKIHPLKKSPFYILKKTEVPSMLLEIGYLSNQKDRAYLENKESQIEIAQHILNFIATIKS